MLVNNKIMLQIIIMEEFGENKGMLTRILLVINFLIKKIKLFQN